MNIFKSLILPILLIASYGNALADTKAKCSYLLGSAEIQLLAPIPGPDPVGFGVINYIIDDEVVQATVTAFMPGPMLNNPDGTLMLPLELLHDFGNGDTLRWYAKAILTPTQNPGVFALSEVVSVIDASGVFEATMGRGIGHGTVSFVDFTATIEADGFICTVKDKHDKDEDDD